MGYTDSSDIFASFHEDAFNRLLGHVQHQRPSLFNYATQEVVNNQKLWCSKVATHPIVSMRGNPTFTVIDPLPVPGSNFGLNFLVQLAELVVDFHKQTNIAIPDELGATLPPQHLAIKVKVCGAIGCPSDEDLDKATPWPQNPDRKPPNEQPVIVLPAREMECFCLDVVAVAEIRFLKNQDLYYLDPKLRGLEIVDIKPDGLENTLECYLKTLLALVVLPNLRILLTRAIFDLTEAAPGLFPQQTSITVSPTPQSAAIPNNPAIEDNLLKVFVEVGVSGP
jgi:hypothetical protein